MYVKQISVFIENKFGRLADITGCIAEHGIDIRAMSLADTTDFGILRLIVDKPYEAEKILKDNSFTVSMTSVIAVGIDDKPGELARAIRVLSDGGVSVEYLYAFVSREAGRASVIIRVDDGDKAVELLTSNGIKFLSDTDIADM